jgi:RNA polymerase sigma-70 factor (ECF subfamily)
VRIDDEVLVERAKQGDRAAFGQLVLAHQQFVYNLALRALADGHEAEDIAQEAFVRAWLALPRFQEHARFRTWLYRITTNLCYTRRPRLRRDLAALDDAALASVPDESQSDPAAGLVAAEARAFLHQAITALPEQYRVLILLRYQQHLAYDEIAGVLDLPLGTVKTGLFRARARLREAFRTFEETGR